MFQKYAVEKVGLSPCVLRELLYLYKVDLLFSVRSFCSHDYLTV